MANLRGGTTIGGYIAWHSGNDGAASSLDADTVDGVHSSAIAMLASPALTGTPTAPTPAIADNNTNIATTAFVKAQAYGTAAALTTHQSSADHDTRYRAAAWTPVTQTVSDAATTTSPSEDALFHALAGKVDDGQVLTNVPAGALFTDTIYTHPTTAGNKHVPAGGAANQVLKYSADGTAVWGTDTDTVYTHPANHPPSIITQDASNRFATDTEKTAWNAKAPLASPTLTGTPLSTTAAVDTNTTQIATTAFVVGQAASTAPLAHGTAAVGTSLKYARQDHVHLGDYVKSTAVKVAGQFDTTTTTPTNTNRLNYDGYFYATSVYGAVWNDYAEFRRSYELINPGRVVLEVGDDYVRQSDERLGAGALVISDTFGYIIGEQNIDGIYCLPTAVAGRVLVYTDKDRNTFKAGDPVCSGPDGTVSKMTRKEVMRYPDRIIGTVSAIPMYNVWGTGNIEVNGRIWIKVK